MGKTGHDDPGKETPADGVCEPRCSVQNRNGRCAAARGAGFEDEATEMFTFKLINPSLCPLIHTFRMVSLTAVIEGCLGTSRRVGNGRMTVRVGVDCVEVRVGRITHEAHGLPGHRHTVFHLGADRYEIEVLRKDLGDIEIQLMPAVVPDRLAQ